MTTSLDRPRAAAAWSAAAALVSFVATIFSGTSLAVLHVLSPEFAPSWRMVSEYANGEVPWLLTMVFLGWAVSSFALVIALRPLKASTLGRVGLLFLVAAGVGEAMGGIFDINHPLHGPAAMIGIPSMCVAAMLVTAAMRRRDDITAPPVWTAHLPWISFACMLGALAMLFSALQGAGVDLSRQSSPMSELPAGVSGYVGWANRLLFLAAYAWAVSVSRAILGTRGWAVMRRQRMPRVA